jgi:hypothetical protein
MPPLRRTLVLPFLLLALSPLCLSASATHAAEPATVEEAAKAIDFTKFPLFGTDPELDYKVVAGQAYSTTGTIAKVAGEVQAELKKRGWKELDGGVITDAYASASFAKGGFALSLSGSPAGDAGKARIHLTNLGNVDFKSLPLPKGAKEVYVSPLMGLYQTDAKPDAVANELKKSLLKQGWSDFGEVIGSFYLRKNAVKLLVSVNEAPGLDGKTAIQLSTEQLSTILLLPEKSEGVQYDDGLTRLMFDSPQSQDELFAFYKKSLGASGWKPTTEKPVHIELSDLVIFRNAKKELIEVSMYEVEGKMRAKVVFQTAERVAELDRLAKAAVDEAKKKREMEANAPIPEAKLKLPKGLKVSEKKDASLEATAATGQGRKIVTAWLKELEKDGWKVKTVVAEDALGNYELTREKIELHLDYVDPGFIPAEVSISIFGKGKLVIGE